jgi:hypothetical protein
LALRLAERAGWFDDVDFGASTLSESVRMVQWMRNFVHPEDSFAKCRRIDPTAIGEIASRYDITAAE